MPIAALIVAIVAALGGVTAASQTAKPGDSLFPVKTTVENVQEALTLNDAQRAQLQAQHALDRLQEVKSQLASGNAKGLPIAIANLEEKSKAAADSATKANNKELAQKIEDELAQAEQEVDELAKSSVTDATDDSLLSDAKDTLNIESDRVLAIVQPDQAKKHLQSALKQAQQEASESAKKVEDTKSSGTSGKSSSSPDDLKAVEVHNTVVTQIAHETETQLTQPTPTTTSGSGSTTSGGTTSGSGETETSGSGGSGGSGGGSSSGSSGGGSGH